MNENLDDFKKILISDEKRKLCSFYIKQLVNILELNNINYCLFMGSLLGFARYNDFIPWDDDFDIFILEDDQNKIDNIFQDLIKKYDLPWKDKDGKEIGNKIYDDLYIRNDLQKYNGWYQIHDFYYQCPIDIFVLKLDTKENNKYIIKSEYFYKGFPKMIFYHDEIFPIKKAQFYNLELNIPNNYDNYLKRAYDVNFKYNIFIQVHSPHIQNILKKFPKKIYNNNNYKIINKYGYETVDYLNNQEIFNLLINN